MAVALAGQPERAGTACLRRQPRQPPVGADRRPLLLQVSPASHSLGGPRQLEGKTVPAPDHPQDSLTVAAPRR